MVVSPPSPLAFAKGDVIVIRLSTPALVVTSISLGFGVFVAGASLFAGLAAPSVLLLLFGALLAAAFRSQQGIRCGC